MFDPRETYKTQMAAGMLAAIALIISKPGVLSVNLIDIFLYDMVLVMFICVLVKKFVCF